MMLRKALTMLLATLFAALPVTDANDRATHVSAKCHNSRQRKMAQTPTPCKQRPVEERTREDSSLVVRKWNVLHASDFHVSSDLALPNKSSESGC